MLPFLTPTVCMYVCMHDVCTYVYCILIRNPRFTREKAEDSHEALRWIFDALKEEEIQVY